MSITIFEFATCDAAEAFSCGIEFANDSALKVNRIYPDELNPVDPMWYVEVWDDDEEENNFKKGVLSCPVEPELHLLNTIQAL
ncbi:hypothetical protein GCM10023116_29570 [Kistimonas scapharcae]|uniref:Uncharacterized protein n=1 Tax=Kistimonas scapharcae TaxID=1036133 RepID=A0ABP8V559_9GAMM